MGTLMKVHTPAIIQLRPKITDMSQSKETPLKKTALNFTKGSVGADSSNPF